MDVYFISKHRGNTVIPCPEIGTKHKIRFVRGKYRTSRKDEIHKLLSDDYCNRNVELAPGQDLENINDYLLSEDRSDVMTAEYLDSIPKEAWKEIIEKRDDISVPFPMIGIAKATLKGKSLTTSVERIVDKYTEKVEVKEFETTKDEDPEEEPKTTEPDDPEFSELEGKTTDDFSVRQIKDLFKNYPKEALEGLLDEDEDRVSVLDIWEDQFSE